jgi:hypothetical protein
MDNIAPAQKRIQGRHPSSAPAADMPIAPTASVGMRAIFTAVTVPKTSASRPAAVSNNRW